MSPTQATDKTRTEPPTPAEHVGWVLGRAARRTHLDRMVLNKRADSYPAVSKSKQCVHAYIALQKLTPYKSPSRTFR